MNSKSSKFASLTHLNEIHINPNYVSNEHVHTVCLANSTARESFCMCIEINELLQISDISEHQLGVYSLIFLIDTFDHFCIHLFVFDQLSCASFMQNFYQYSTWDHIVEDRENSILFLSLFALLYLWYNYAFLSCDLLMKMNQWIFTKIFSFLGSQWTGFIKFAAMFYHLPSHVSISSLSMFMLSRHTEWHIRFLVMFFEIGFIFWEIDLAHLIFSTLTPSICQLILPRLRIKFYQKLLPMLFLPTIFLC